MLVVFKLSLTSLELIPSLSKLGSAIAKPNINVLAVGFCDLNPTYDIINLATRNTPQSFVIEF